MQDKRRYKKGERLEIKVDEVLYPSSSQSHVEGDRIEFSGGLPEQKVAVYIKKARSKNYKAGLLEVLEKAPYEGPSLCEHDDFCGGCARQTVPYEKQLEIKVSAVENLARKMGLALKVSAISPSPSQFAYRNKMEYSFGDEYAGGELNLGLHKKNKNFDVISISDCKLTHPDFEVIRFAVEQYARESGKEKYNQKKLTGFWRNLVVRRGVRSGEILIAISVSSQDELDREGFVKTLLGLELEGNIVGIMLLINDASADVVRPGERDEVLYGRPYYREELLGMSFKVSLFSFFQTNTEAASILFDKAFSKLSGLDNKIVFDLFCGVGTIGRLISKRAKRVVGIEIVEEAVEMANLSCKEEGIANATFLAGDVFKVLNDEQLLFQHDIDRCDTIILDPPRSGVSPKTILKIAAFGAPEILYISCNPKTMLENIAQLQELGYQAGDIELCDLYPHTPHVETVVLMSRVEK